MAATAPQFLSIEEVLELHADLITRYGGSAGIREHGLLASAVEAPAASFGGAFLHKDLAEMAAAYLFHIVMNHPFVDGNKRTASMAAYVFLEINNVPFDADGIEFGDMTLACAAGTLDKDGVTAFFRRHIPPTANLSFDNEP